MRKSKLALLVAAAFALTAVSVVVYARDSDGSMMRGVMGGGMMRGGTGMSRMMGHCGGMMRGDHGSTGRPNEQWRSAPDRQN